MSEQADQPAGAEVPVAEAPAGVEAAAPATTQDDIDTESFDRMEAPDEPDAEAGDGQPAEGETPDTPPAGAEEAETIEVEVNGQKYQVPKALEAEIRKGADYTKKTQALAEQRREVETEAATLAEQRAQQVESLKAFRNEHMTVASKETELAQIEAEISGYAQYTRAAWEATEAENPALYKHHLDRFEKLRAMRAITAEALTLAKTDLETKEAKLTEDQKAARQSALSKAWGETNATLSKKIEGWSPAKGQELGKMLVEQFGVSPEELREATDARVWIMADEVSRLRAENAKLKTTNKQTTATEAALKSQTVTPAVKPAGGGARSTGVHDGLSDEEWIRRRNAQVARKAAGR